MTNYITQKLKALITEKYINLGNILCRLATSVSNSADNKISQHSSIPCSTSNTLLNGKNRKSQKAFWKVSFYL